MEPGILKKMITDVIDETTGQPKPSIDGSIPMYSGISGKKLEDSKILAEPVRSLARAKDALITHLDDEIPHFAPGEKEKFDNMTIIVPQHLASSAMHVSDADRARWDAKETPEQAQAKADAVQANLDEHINDFDKHLTPDEKIMLNGGIYNKTEIDNKLAELTNGLTWKDAVQKHEDLYIVYADAEDGWTANVLEDNITYRFTIPKNIPTVGDVSELTPELAQQYQLVFVESIGNYMKWNGTEWVLTSTIGDWIAISANAITKATVDKDGLMSKEDYSKLALIEDEANNYIHPEELKHLSEEEKNNYLEVYDCIRNGDPKITIDVEGIATYKYHGIFTPAERQKLEMIEDEANYYVHPDSHPASMIEESNDRVFLTKEQRESLGNMATKTLASVNLDGLMSKEMYIKLSEIEFKANNYIHPVSHPATMIDQDENHLFVSTEEKNNWNDPPEVTIESKGVMSSEDKIKLDSISLEEIAKIPELEEDIEDIFDSIKSGILDFSIAGTVIEHNIGDLEYSVMVMPISLDGTNPLENVSNIWVEYAENSCTVHADINDVSKITKFSYTIISIQD